MKIYMSDLRKTKMCARGTRAFFLSKGWDWQGFLKNGIDLEIVEQANDAMAQQVVEYVKNGREQ
jgi:hypothetical protein